MKKKYEWMKTDTAAIMFTSLNTNNSSRIIRLSVVLKEGEVDPVLLRRAVFELLPRFPSFTQRLRKGFFWAYLEKTYSMPEICMEREVPALPQWFGKDGSPEFHVLYYKRRISLEASHVLCDGTGLLRFLNAITAHYLTLSGTDTSKCEGIMHPNETPTPTESENAYVRYHTKEKLPELERAKAYQMPLVLEKNYVKHVLGFMPSDEVKEKGRQYGLTITEYLAAVLIHSIIRISDKAINETISIAIPLNMRKYFDTDTLRNFSTHVPIEFNPQGRRDCSIEEICKVVEGQLKNKITKENIQSFLNKTYALTEKTYLRIIPFFIKKPGLLQIQKKTHQRIVSLMLSNLGNITLPEVMSEKIERYELIGGDPRKYGLTTFCAGIGVNGHLCICFSTANSDSALYKEFFTSLSAQGIRVRIESPNPV